MIKKSLIYYFVLFTIVLIVNISCSKEDKDTKSDIIIDDSNIIECDEPLLTAEIRNKIIDELSQVIALSLTENDVRRMLHNELNKQFTFDYDILYSFVADKEVNTKFGKLKYVELLHKLAADNNICLDYLDKNLENFKNLQISAPSYFEGWQTENFIPEVISLPVEYIENKSIKVKSYASNGTFSLVTEEDINKPFLLVRESERVDPTGMIRVDINNFVLPPNYRTLTAYSAYKISELKSFSENENMESVIIKVPDNEFDLPDSLNNNSKKSYDINNSINSDIIQLNA
jgi:hypothetical protein